MSSLSEKLISGAGGGGGKGGGGGTARVAVESPDSLRSRQYARVLDALCEGPIVGLVNGAQSVFLNDVPLQNADSSYNFSGVNLATQLGTQIQSYLPGYGDPQAATTVGVEIKAASPVVQTIAANANLDAIQVTIGFPTLTYQNPSNGDIGGTSVDIAIDLQTNGGGYLQIIADTITGKTTTRYQRAYRVALTGTGPWDIRVRRITADSTASNLQNKTFWDLYVGIIDSKLRYPNTALVGLQIDASQFNAIPKRSYDVKMLQVSIPANYNPTTRVYTGVWDGTFVTAWTDNPAWCFYDLLTNSRYGLGEFVQAAQVDKWGLYAIAKYCDQLVPNGFGGTEPRFTCNLYLQTQAAAYTVLMNFASLFRAITYWGSGAIYTVQDAPATPIAHFTNGSVIDGEFSYSGSSRRGRHTVVLVSWNDPADYYRQKIEYVSDDAGIARYGVQQTSIVAMGCTSRGQANRLGKWMLLSETLELEVVTFKAGLDGTSLYPGAIIRTLDRHRAGVRYGGRVVAATTTSLTIDSPVTLSSGISYNVTVILPDGTLATNTLTNVPGATSILTWTTALATLPQLNSVWLLAADNVNPEVWRVITLVEKDMSQVEVTALAHDVNKYANSENTLQLAPLPTTTITLMQVPVASVAITTNTAQPLDSSLLLEIQIAWPAAVNATGYRVELRRDSDNWVLIGNTTSLIAVAGIKQEGTYTARVTALSALGAPSVSTLSAATAIYWSSVPPPDVTGFAVKQNGGVVTFNWAQVGYLAIKGYDVRYGAQTITDWNLLTPLTEATRGTEMTNASVPPGAWVFAIRARNVIDQLSVTMATTTLTVTNENPTISVRQECPGLDGTVSGFLKHWTGVLAPLGQFACSTYTHWEDFGVVYLGSTPYVPDPVATATYTQNAQDTAYNDTLRLWSIITATPGPSVSGTPVTAFSLDYWLSGAVDPNVFNAWGSASAQLRYFRGRVTETPGIVPSYISVFTITADKQSANKSDGANFVVAAGGTAVTFTATFHAPPFVNCIVIGSTALFATASNITATGCTIHVFNTSGADVGGTVNWTASGF
ncbi:MAG: phage tail protein [Sulfuriferula sp.]